MRSLTQRSHTENPHESTDDDVDDDQINDLCLNHNSHSHSPVSSSEARLGRHGQPKFRNLPPSCLMPPGDVNVVGEDEFTKKAFDALSSIKLKLPGKDEDQTNEDLQGIDKNWEYHKPFMTAYWTRTLDFTKRGKVIAIVRSYVETILQQVWKTSELGRIRARRIFSRVFNRMLWNQGRGLLECMETITGNSWLVVFNKNTDSLTRMEFACCDLIVDLCCQCMLIVYKCSSDANARHSHTGNGLTGSLAVDTTSN